MKWRRVPNIKLLPPAAGNEETFWGRSKVCTEARGKTSTSGNLDSNLFLSSVPAFLCPFPHCQIHDFSSAFLTPTTSLPVFLGIQASSPRDHSVSVSPVLRLYVSSTTPVLLWGFCLFVFVFYSNSESKPRSSQALGHKTLQYTGELHLPTQFQPFWWTRQDSEVFETPGGMCVTPICCSFPALRRLLQNLMRHEVGQGH